MKVESKMTLRPLDELHRQGAQLHILEVNRPRSAWLGRLRPRHTEGRCPPRASQQYSPCLRPRLLSALLRRPDWWKQPIVR